MRLCAFGSKVTDVFQFFQKITEVHRQANRAHQRDDAQHQLSRFATGTVVHHSPNPEHQRKKDGEDDENQMERLERHVQFILFLLARLGLGTAASTGAG